MNELWYCPECKRPVELNVHGKCSLCGSDAVVTMAANFRRPTKPSEAVETARQFLEALRFIEKQREADTELLELERMWELK